MGNTNRLILETDLTEFFRQEVVSARSDLGIELSDGAEYYVVNLLCDFSHQDVAPTPGEEPLAILYKRSLEAAAPEKVQLLKELGDIALYVSGFFTEFIERSLVDMDYYVTMGGGAYESLSNLVASRPSGAHVGELYLQLSGQFTELVDLLNQISDRSKGQTDNEQDLLKLYDRWVRTGSERMRKLLMAQGLVPTDAVPTDYIQ